MRNNQGTDAVPDGRVVRRSITGAEFLGAFEHASRVIADRRDQLNALNVFPVPDGDTGTNMSLTMKSAIDAANQIAADSSPTVDGVTSKIAFGALMGARGNSGVILSQILRGFSSAIEAKTDLDAADVVRALDNAVVVAYKAVANPVEGTMLSVIAEASRAASAAYTQTASVTDVFDAAADGAEAGLARTPDALEVLRRARVVDAGGQGVAYILRAMANSLRGDFTIIQIGQLNPTPALENLTMDGDGHVGGESGYCTNFIVTGEDIDLDVLRRELDWIGTSVVVVGDRSLVKAHVHTNRPDQALAVALVHGSLDRVAIDSMDRQIGEVAASLARTSQSIRTDSEITGLHAVVTVADGSGFVDILLSLGATTVLQLRSEAKPSTEELLRAVESAMADDVILLPNASETIGAARIVTGLTDKRVVIVPSTSVVAGVAALSAMNPSADLGTNAGQMTNALADASYAELSVAAKDATVDGIEVVSGDVLFFANGRLTATGSKLEDVVQRGLAEFTVSGPEVIALFTGDNVDPDRTAMIERILGATFADAGIETLEGGQAFYQYIISFD